MPAGSRWRSHGDHGPETVTTLSERDVIETVNGKEARVTMVEVTFEPGASRPAAPPPGPIFGYVLEGEFELGLDDQPAKTLKAGETFYEPSGALHRVSRNPSAKTKTRVLAVILHPRDAKETHDPGRQGVTHESLRRRSQRGHRPAAGRRIGPPGPRGHGHDAIRVRGAEPRRPGCGRRPGERL